MQFSEGLAAQVLSVKRFPPCLRSARAGLRAGRSKASSPDPAQAGCRPVTGVGFR